jgi:hypothetical protein
MPKKSGGGKNRSMTKIVTMHQPNYLPWIGLFSKVKLATHFIVYNTAQYTNHGVVNRNKIRNTTGWCYLTIPIRRDFAYTKINEVTLPENQKWQHTHWQTIYLNYARTPFFKEHKDFFEDLYHQNFQYLWQLNEKIILYLLECFNIDVEVIRTSQLQITPDLHKTDAMIAYLKCLGTDVYISGPSGRDYLEMEKFSQNNISVKFFKFQHPIYRRRYSGFMENMSAIDLLFNLGPEAAEVVAKAGSLEAEIYTLPSTLPENPEYQVNTFKGLMPSYQVNRVMATRMD